MAARPWTLNEWRLLGGDLAAGRESLLEHAVQQAGLGRGRAKTAGRH